MDWELKFHSVVWAYQVAHKTTIGTTHFNMVYGLDVILPLKFLVPTLRVAQEIGWIGHELSNRVAELEKLDETRLVAIASMYALKRRQKKIHDHHIITKRFKLGDLVLFFTIKEFATKLSKQGKGPYILTRLSASGAVKLSTLEGEEMPNWISEYRLKKYYTPLTKEQMKTLHEAKWRKQNNQWKAKLAREEARQRERNEKEK